MGRGRAPSPIRRKVISFSKAEGRESPTKQPRRSVPGKQTPCAEKKT